MDTYWPALRPSVRDARSVISGGEKFSADRVVVGASLKLVIGAPDVSVVWPLIIVPLLWNACRPGHVFPEKLRAGHTRNANKCSVSRLDIVIFGVPQVFPRILCRYY